MKPVPLEVAVQHLLDAVIPQPTIRVPLSVASGHLLAENIEAAWPSPRWPSSSMDGFAVRATDIKGATQSSPVQLPIVGDSAAGSEQPPPLLPKSARRVATGGWVPEQADTVVRVEDTAVAGDVVTVLSDRDSGKHLRPMGGEFNQGDLALRSGSNIDAGTIALMATLGVAAPLVFRRPSVVIATSGNELTSIDQLEQVRVGTRIVDANQPMLVELAKQYGCTVKASGPLRDDPDNVVTAIRSADEADLVVTAGAISVGEHDHIPEAMDRLGARKLFRRVLIRPGGPATAAVLPDGRLWLALPGNPVSAMVVFHLLAVPVIRALRGYQQPATVLEQAVLGEPIQRHPRLELFPRIVLKGTSPPTATLTGGQASWQTTSIATADGLLRISAGEGAITAGSVVPLLRLRSIVAAPGQPH